jgi:polyhydroxyalkanoate synthase
MSNDIPDNPFANFAAFGAGFDMSQFDPAKMASGTLPGTEDVQQWMSVMQQAQAMMTEHMSQLAQSDDNMLSKLWNPQYWQEQMARFDKGGLHNMMQQQNALWQQGMEYWQAMLTGKAPETTKSDRRFQAAEWQEQMAFAALQQNYLLMSDHLLKLTDGMEGLEPSAKAKLTFAMQNMIDAMSPANFALTNPQVIQKTVETKGQNLLKGLEHMLADIRKGQMTHTDPNAFELGRNIAVTPGKVVHETALYQLIQYEPATKKVDSIPLVIFPPWINRFYILDLNEKKSFVKWAVDQGITVFIVSWKSADETLRDIIWDDYVMSQIDAMTTIRDALDVPHVNAIGYCVSGTTLAATLALLEARGESDLVGSATFFTAQVDFADAGELQHFIDDDQLAMIDHLSAETGYLDGRYMALTFNMLRGRDLIWNYVVNNYLLGQEYPPFDLLHWNGDTTNLPAKWHRAYLIDLYRDNKLVQPGAITIDGTAIDLRKIQTPCFIQAGIDDHIAPAPSVWKLMHHLSGPKEFMLAGSGHIAGVVNPPKAKKYQYWTRPEGAETLDDFKQKAQEHPGSWWPYWREWIGQHGGKKVAATGARLPGNGTLPAIEDAPGRYVKQ